MTKRVKVLTKHGDVYRSQFELRQGSNDKSVYLRVTDPVKPTDARLEFVPSNGSKTVKINLNMLKTVKGIDHSSVHEGGESHTVLKPRGLGTVGVNAGIPLKDLDGVKHLWTLILRDFSLSWEVSRQKNDLVMEQPIGLNNLIVDVLAVPKATLNFTYEEELNNKVPVNMNVSFYVAELEDFNIVLFARGTDQFKETPQHTFKIHGQDGWIPMIKSIKRDQIVVEASPLNFAKVTQSKN